jgi:hypothetical protein
MSRPRASAAPKPVPARAEWALLGLLVAALLSAWAFQYHPFLLPNNDYYSFERAARSLAAGELPANFKRMPVFPAAMALVEPFVPGRHAFLHAGLLVNQAFSVGFLVALFALARVTFGAGAVLVPLAVVATVQFHAMGLQPLVEPSLSFFVALAFVGAARRSPWQYAAAFAVALSRYEAAVLLPVLFAVNAGFERRFWRHAVLAGLAGSGLAVWMLLSATQGRGGGGSFYFELMEGMGWQPAPGFLARSLREPFRGWAASGPVLAPVLALAAVLPVAAGLREGWRRFRRETVALAAFWVAEVGLVVGFGIDKARYVHPTQWIPVFFWAAGVARIAPALAAALTRRGPRAAGAAALGALGLFALLAAGAVRDVAGAPHVTPAGAEIAFALAALAIGLAAAFRLAGAGPRAPAPAAVALALGALLAALLGGGLQAKARELGKIHHANHDAFVLAPWLEANLGDDRALLLPRTHVVHLTGLPWRRFTVYAAFEAESPEALARQMRERGVRYAIYTWRRTPDDPAERFYHRIKHAALADWFRDGGAVPGFEHVATLPLPAELRRPAVQIYQLPPEAPRAD